MSRSPVLPLAAALAAAALCSAAPARAEKAGLEQDWRQRARRGERSGWLDPEHFAFEVRFGPYWPQVDEELSGKSPYEDVFGSDARFYFGLELDWLPARIPYVGSLGGGYGWGYTHSSAKAMISGTGEASAADTGLTVLPMHVSAVLRGDYLLREHSVPVVPYIKLGLGWGMWTASGSDGTSKYEGVAGQGTSLGLHSAVGAALALNAFDPRTAVSLRESSGVDYAFLFGEWMGANLDGIGSKPQMHVGTSTFVLGLAIDW
ncbi:MAG: hypothetical protein HY744_03960 [Deltaproteobacteria bacterium]|nr:hypothetical protein [Deltaproteobacteria bacterium]